MWSMMRILITFTQCFPIFLFHYLHRPSEVALTFPTSTDVIQSVKYYIFRNFQFAFDFQKKGLRLVIPPPPAFTVFAKQRTQMAKIYIIFFEINVLEGSIFSLLSQNKLEELFFLRVAPIKFDLPPWMGTPLLTLSHPKQRSWASPNDRNTIAHVTLLSLKTSACGSCAALLSFKTSQENFCASFYSASTNTREYTQLCDIVRSQCFRIATNNVKTDFIPD